MKNLSSFPLGFPTPGPGVVHAVLGNRDWIAWRSIGAAALCLGLTLSVAASGGPPAHYQQTNLVSDVPGGSIR